MQKCTLILFVVFTSIAFVSCQKEKSDEQRSSGNIQGNYKFISMTAKTNVTQQISSGGDVDKAVTTSNYTTTNNTGTMKIDAATMSSNNLSYTVNTIAKGYFYTNGTLEDSVDAPLQFTMPASSSTAAYQMVGSDSVYFSSGTMFMNGINQKTQPGGARLKVEDDKLYMTISVNQTSTQNVQGETVLSDTKGTMIITLQKQ